MIVDERKCLDCSYHFTDDGGVYCSRKPIIYLSHIYQGKQENADRLAKIMLQLVKKYPNLNFFSPVHNFPFYDDLDYETGLQRCIDFLPYCQSMWVIGEWENSIGCQAEIKFCKTHRIPIRYITLKGGDAE